MKSDESAELEKKKSKLVKLKDVDHLNERQSNEKTRLEKELSEVPVRLRSNAVAPQEQIDLLKKIHSELAGKR